MPFDNICLAAAVKDCQTLIGAKLTKIYQPDKYTVLLRLYGEGKQHRLLLCANPQDGRLQTTQFNAENPAKPPLFCMVLRKHLENARLLKLQQTPGERIVRLDFAAHDEIGTPTARTLVLEIMGKHSNLLLLDTPSGQIIDAARRYSHNVSRHREVLPGVTYLAPPASERPDWQRLEPEKLAELLLNGNLSLPPARLLQSTIAGLSSQLAAEICYRAGLQELNNCEQLGEYEINRLDQQLQKMRQILAEGRFQPVLLRQTNSRPVAYLGFYPLPLLAVESNIEQHEFVDFSSALDCFYQSRLLQQSFNAEQHQLAKLLNKEEQRLHKKIKLQTADLQAAGNAEQYKNAGELLTAYLHLVQPGQKQVELPSFYDPEQLMRIKLRPELSAAENAKRYFHRYNKAKNAEKQITRQLELNRAEYDYVQSLQAALAEAEDLTDLQAVSQEMQTAGYQKRHPTNQKQNKLNAGSLPPRRYQTSDGFTLLLGRNNRQNDRLTTKMAAPDDIWLHTQKIPGSHVILKREAGLDFTETALREAAALAAYHSQARQADKVPVDYTEVHNVKKPNGARPGMVIYFEQQTLYVQPRELTPCEDTED